MRIFLSKEKHTEVIAIEEALKVVKLSLNIEKILKKKLELIEACYVYSVIEQ